MSPTERAFWDKQMRRAWSLRPDLQAGVLASFRALRDALAALSEPDVEKLIAAGTADIIATQVLSSAVLDRAFLPARAAVRDAIERSFGWSVADLPKRITLVFDRLNPDVITAIRRLETAVMQPLQTEARETVRAFVENGLRDGVNPRTIARNIRSVVGLGPSQLEQVENFRDALLGQNGRSVANYTLRDKRFKAPSTPEQIDKAVEAYRKARIAQNAETVSRTASLDAMKLGQQLSWKAAIDAGYVDGDRLTKTWVGVLDDRERPEHVAMEKQTVPFDEPYSNGQMIPGDDEYNCRCISVYRQAA